MVLTGIIFLLFIIAFVFAKIADKNRDKFQFDMLPNEKILQVENDVTFFGINRRLGKTGILYLTSICCYCFPLVKGIQKNVI